MTSRREEGEVPVPTLHLCWVGFCPITWVDVVSLLCWKHKWSPEAAPEHLPNLPFFDVTFLPGHCKTMSLRLCLWMSVITCTKPSCGINQCTQCLKVKLSSGWLMTRSAGANGPMRMGADINLWLSTPWLPRGGNSIKRSIKRSVSLTLTSLWWKPGSKEAITESQNLFPNTVLTVSVYYIKSRKVLYKVQDPTA